METLTDKQIDPLTAQYFCIFADKQIRQFLQQSTDEKNINGTIQNLVKQSAKKNSLNEAEAKEMTSFLNENWLTDKVSQGVSSAKNAAKSEIADTVAKSTAVSTQAAIDTVTSAANQEKLAAAASKTSQAASAAAVDTAIDKLKSNQETFNQMSHDAGAAATQGAVDTLAANNATLNQMSHDAGSSAAQGAIDTAAANSDKIQKMSQDAGAAATTGALNTLKGAAKGALSAAMPWLIGAAITTVGAFLWPKVKGVFKKMFRKSAQEKNSLAFVKFQDVDDNRWQFYFSKDKMLWKLDNMDSGEDVPRQQTAAFMQTEFASRFMTQCQKYVRNVLDSELNINILAKQMSDSEPKQYFESIVKNKDRIYDRMFNGKC